MTIDFTLTLQDLNGRPVHIRLGDGASVPLTLARVVVAAIENDRPDNPNQREEMGVVTQKTELQVRIYQAKAPIEVSPTEVGQLQKWVAGLPTDFIPTIGNLLRGQAIKLLEGKSLGLPAPPVPPVPPAAEPAPPA